MVINEILFWVFSGKKCIHSFSDCLFLPMMHGNQKVKIPVCQNIACRHLTLFQYYTTQTLIFYVNVHRIYYATEKNTCFCH